MLCRFSKTCRVRFHQWLTTICYSELCTHRNHQLQIPIVTKPTCTCADCGTAGPVVRVFSPEALRAIASECLSSSRPCMGTYAPGSADRGVLCCWPCIFVLGDSPWLAWRGHGWLCVAAMARKGFYYALFPDSVAGVRSHPNGALLFRSLHSHPVTASLPAVCLSLPHTQIQLHTCSSCKPGRMPGSSNCTGVPC